MSLDLWLAFVAASAALLLVPGPTVLLVLSYALSQGRRVAVATALGVATGDLVAITVALAGLGALVMASATAFTVLKWAGAAYLLWLGWRMLRAAGDADALEAGGARARAAPATVFRHAALVTALNPKSLGFFLAFLPQFIRPDTAFLPQAAAIVVTFVTLAALNALAYALLADRLRARIASARVTRTLSRLGGATLMGMGLATALIRRSA